MKISHDYVKFSDFYTNIKNILKQKEEKHFVVPIYFINIAIC